MSLTLDIFFGLRIADFAVYALSDSDDRFLLCHNSTPNDALEEHHEIGQSRVCYLTKAQVAVL